ncbi:MAG: hypothetical protein H7Y39_18205 [Nitrospiraceae bacterium]|nr:hypothetical protein [Nitrospiraceae bacterium]
MALLRIGFISSFLLLCLIPLIGAQLFPAPTSHLPSSEESWIGKHVATDSPLVGVIRVGSGKKARKMMPLVQTCSPGVCIRVSASPPLTERTVNALPHTHALRVHQRISVYRI